MTALAQLSMVLCLSRPALAATPAESLDALLKGPSPAPALALVEAGEAALPQMQEALKLNSRSPAGALMAWALCQHPVPAARESLEAALKSSHS